jgi:DNA polymerase
MTPVTVVLAPGADLDGFRAALRRLVAAEVPPEAVLWSGGSAGLFAPEAVAAAPPVPLPGAVAELIRLVVCHRDPERFALLYRLVWRVRHGERALLEVASDPLVHRLGRMAKAVRRDLHKMHAFVRFRRVEDAGGERFVAWFEPEHFILEATAGFFARRFPSQDWSILTPIGALHQEGGVLSFGPGRAADAPVGDGFEAGWRDYYESTFNPARLNLVAMRSEMPKKYWKNMPETAAIPEMVRAAPDRVRQMIAAGTAAPRRRSPDKAVAAMADQDPRTLEALNAQIASAAPMVEGGRRAVLGEGPVGAPIAFVGEQPGDQEDLAGRPFVGPAGQLLDRALAEAGIDRGGAYLTNAVKHFKFVQRGKRRLHQRPLAGEVKHYRWWLKTEIELVGPRLVVALGATAALALTGRAVSVTRERGETRFENRAGFVTVHPSYLLRLPDAAAKREAWEAFLRDLRQIRDLAA